MKQLRNRAVLLIGWLVILYLSAHYWYPPKITAFSYLYTLAIVLISLAFAPLRKLHVAWLIIFPVVLFIVLKILFDIPVAGDALSGTAVEVLSIVITMLLIASVSIGIQEFENAVSEVTIGKQKHELLPEAKGTGVLYREVRRARNHQRPLSILAVSVDEKSINGSLSDLIKNAQQSVIKQFTMANVTRTLCEKLEDCDIIVQTDDHFLIVLPETRPEDLPGLTDRLHSIISSQVGVELNIGSASLPQDSFTLEGLIEKATQGMERPSETELYIEPEQLLIKDKAG